MQRCMTYLLGLHKLKQLNNYSLNNSNYEYEKIKNSAGKN